MIEMQTIDSNDKPSPRIELFLDGEEVSGRADRCYVSIEPGVEVPGWANILPDPLVSFDQSSGEAKFLPSVRTNGLVMWRPING